MQSCIITGTMTLGAAAGAVTDSGVRAAAKVPGHRVSRHTA